MKTLTETYFNPSRGVSYPEIDEAYSQLEENGFMIDVPYLNAQAEKAREDEQLSLRKLRLVSKSAGLESQSDEYIDSIWSSPVKLKRLLHEEWKLEPSPIWKKGEVAQWKGEIKTDSVALEYLANANPSVRGIIQELLHLKRIRSSLKYLEKLPRFVQTDGFIHPVYGASSDTDESSGTNSGRTVLKNPEGQQIPAGKDKDPYGIRKGFIAPPGQVLVVRDYAAMEAVLLHAICVQLFDDYSLADANSSTFHSENARIVFGEHLKWKHPNGKPIKDFDLAEFSTDPYLKDRRRDAKTVFYGLQFCKSVRGFGWTLLDSDGLPIGESLAGEIVAAFHHARPAIRKLQDFVFDILKSYRKNDKRVVGICDFVGRYRNVDTLLQEYFNTGMVDWRFRKAWRQCCNHPCQAGGANIKTTALVHALNAGLVVQMDIHDELIVRCNPDDVERVQSKLQWCMEETFPLPAGIKLRTAGESGPNWYEAK